jgi:catechol 2,3-dioxygenase
LFLGAGGYHHHVGTNTWPGPTARPPEPDDARLLEWTMELPTRDDVTDVERSLTLAGHMVERTSGDAIVTADPWGTVVRVQSEQA